MIDYRAHALGLENVRERLANESFSEPTLDAARDDVLADMAADEGSALLGSLVDHLVSHAASDGTELGLVRRAAELWGEGVSLYDSLGQVRSELEAALEAPGQAGAAARFNSAAAEAKRSAERLHGLQGRIFLLRDEIEPLPHLPPHPRQQNEPAEAWDWGNFMLARRTDAFVRSLGKRAEDTTSRAFAFGALASFGANVAGSPYLSHVTGGPRRAHHYRDRLARNSVGSWLKGEHPSIPTLSEMAEKVGFAGTKLPTRIRQQMEAAVEETFDPSQTPPLPDLDRGYERLVEHLRLLDGFQMPEAPPMPTEHFVELLYGDPANPPPTLTPQSAGVPEAGSSAGLGSGPEGPGTETPGSDDSKKSSSLGCGALIAVFILIALLLVVTLINCIIKWADGKKCNYFDELGSLVEEMFGGGGEAQISTSEEFIITDQGLNAFAQTEQAHQLVGHFWQMQSQMWEALDRAYGYLAKCGLIYPDDQIENPGYRQFTAIPAAARFAWPHRAVPDAIDSYHLFPDVFTEEPEESPSPFPAGATPDAFATEPPAGQSFTAAQVALPLWMQLVRHHVDATNYDLDADRGYRFPCWRTGGSIEDDPVETDVLAYGEQ